MVDHHKKLRPLEVLLPSPQSNIYPCCGCVARHMIIALRAVQAGWMFAETMVLLSLV
jgi:hypothetical protein